MFIILAYRLFLTFALLSSVHVVQTSRALYTILQPVSKAIYAQPQSIQRNTQSIRYDLAVVDHALLFTLVVFEHQTAALIVKEVQALQQRIEWKTFRRVRRGLEDQGLIHCQSEPLTLPLCFEEQHSSDAATIAVERFRVHSFLQATGKTVQCPVGEKFRLLATLPLEEFCQPESEPFVFSRGALAIRREFLKQAIEPGLSQLPAPSHFHSPCNSNAAQK